MAEQGQGIPVNITAPEFMQYMMQSQATANTLITQLQAQNVQLAEQNANLSARLQDLEARFVEGGKGLGKSKGYPPGGPGGAAGGHNGLADAMEKILSKITLPGKLKKESQWPEWVLKFRKFCKKLHPVLEDLLRRTEERDATSEGGEFLFNAALTPEEAQASEALHYSLFGFCEDEFLDIITNSGDNEGCEAWKRLTNRLDPIDRQGAARLFMVLNQWDFSGDFQARLESWEKEVKRYEKRSKDTVSIDKKIGIVLSRMDPSSKLYEHLCLNSNKYDTWAAFKKDVSDLKRTLEGSSGQQDMDVDALGGHKKGPVDKSKIECHNCHKKGHYKSECRAKGGGAYRQSGTDPKQQPGAKAKAKAKASPVKCKKCGKIGHTADKCRSKKSVRDTDDADEPADDDEEEPECGDCEEDVAGIFLDSLTNVTSIPSAVRKGGTADATKQCGCKTVRIKDESGIKDLSAVSPDKIRKIRIGVDSCACESVMSEDILHDYPLNTKGRGRKYQCANKTKIVDQGSRHIFGRIQGRSAVSAWRFRVTKVHRALLSVSQMVDQGYRVVFDSDDTCGRGGSTDSRKDVSYFQNKETGVKVKIPRSGRTYEIEMDVLPYKEAKGFQRPKQPVFRSGRGLPRDMAAVLP